MTIDPIVEDVRQTRERIMAECQGDIETLIARLRTASSSAQTPRVTLNKVKQRKQTSKPAV